MMFIANLIQRIWPHRKVHETDAAARFSDNRDRSSMAEYVRILQAHDFPRTDRNSA